MVDCDVVGCGEDALLCGAPLRGRHGGERGEAEVRGEEGRQLAGFFELPARL